MAVIGILPGGGVGGPGVGVRVLGKCIYFEKPRI